MSALTTGTFKPDMTKNYCLVLLIYNWKKHPEPFGTSAVQKCHFVCWLKSFMPLHPTKSGADVAMVTDTICRVCDHGVLRISYDWRKKNGTNILTQVGDFGHTMLWLNHCYLHLWTALAPITGNGGGRKRIKERVWKKGDGVQVDEREREQSRWKKQGEKSGERGDEGSWESKKVTN